MERHSKLSKNGSNDNQPNSGILQALSQSYEFSEEKAKTSRRMLMGFPIQIHTRSIINGKIPFDTEKIERMNSEILENEPLTPAKMALIISELLYLYFFIFANLSPFQTTVVEEINSFLFRPG